MGELDRNEPSEWGRDYYGYRPQCFLSEPAPSYVWVTRNGELLNNAPALLFQHPIRTACGAISVRHSVRLKVNIGREPFHQTVLPSFSAMREKLSVPSVRYLITVTSPELVKRIPLRRTAFLLEPKNPMVAVYLLREAMRLARYNMSNDRVRCSFPVFFCCSTSARNFLTWRHRLTLASS